MVRYHTITPKKRNVLPCLDAWIWRSKKPHLPPTLPCQGIRLIVNLRPYVDSGVLLNFVCSQRVLDLRSFAYSIFELGVVTKVRVQKRSSYTFHSFILSLVGSFLLVSELLGYVISAFPPRTCGSDCPCSCSKWCK